MTATNAQRPEPMTGDQAAAYQRLRAHLAYLKLPTAAEQLPAVLDAARTQKLSITAALERLLHAEVTATEQRRLAGRLRFASLPAPWTLEDLDYDASPALDRTLRVHIVLPCEHQTGTPSSGWWRSETATLEGVPLDVAAPRCECPRWGHSVSRPGEVQASGVNVNHVEVETLQWIDWFNTERPHEYLDDLTPARAEQLHYHLRAPAQAG